MSTPECKKIADGADRRTSSGRPRVRKHEHAGSPGTHGIWIGEVADSGAPEDGFLGRGARVIHASGCVHLALKEVMVRRAGQYLQQAPRYDHPAIRVADVFVWPEESPAVLPETFEEELQGTAAPGIKEKQVGIDPIGMCQKIPDTDLFGPCGRNQLELRQVLDCALSEINDAALDL